jgi:hypothetical protein
VHRISTLLIAALAILGIAASAHASSLNATTGDATDVTATAATLNGKIKPKDDGVTYSFEYGTTSAYGSRTPATAAVKANSTLPVKTSVTDLEPSTLYHFRVVAEAGDNTETGSDRTFTTTAPDSSGTSPDGGSFEEPIDDVGPGSGDSQGTDDSPDPEPVLGRSLGAGPASGAVSVKVPGASTFVALDGNAAIPTGSTLDARRGSVRIVTALDAAGATQAASFGGAKFKVVQRRGAHGLTDILLRGGSFKSCHRASGSAKTASAAGRRRAVRRLWGRDHHGRFRSHGRGAVATVRGTVWVMADRCDGTLTSVRQGAVSVRDLARGRTVLLHAHERYLARPGR